MKRWRVIASEILTLKGVRRKRVKDSKRTKRERQTQTERKKKI
jgi:hypothetical protein